MSDADTGFSEDQLATITQLIEKAVAKCVAPPASGGVDKAASSSGPGADGGGVDGPGTSAGARDSDDPSAGE